MSRRLAHAAGARLRRSSGALWLALACGGGDPGLRTPAPAPVLTIRLQSTPATNGGGALHVLVRRTTRVDYPRLAYEDIVASLSQKSDPSTLAWEVLRPGTTPEYQVRLPEEGALGVYFLFSHPGPRWRHLLADEQAGSVTYRLGADSIEAIEVTAQAGP